MHLTLPAPLSTAIREAAEAAWPAEGCGLLVGRWLADGRAVVDEVVAAGNLRQDRPDRFELDPAVHIATLRRLRGTDRCILGHWHSHPDGPARPSAHDRAQANDPGLLWLIVAVSAGFAGDAAAFRLQDGEFSPVSIISEKSPC